MILCWLSVQAVNTPVCSSAQAKRYGHEKSTAIRIHCSYECYLSNRERRRTKWSRAQSCWNARSTRLVATFGIPRKLTRACLRAALLQQKRVKARQPRITLGCLAWTTEQFASPPAHSRFEMPRSTRHVNDRLSYWKAVLLRCVFVFASAGCNEVWFCWRWSRFTRGLRVEMNRFSSFYSFWLRNRWFRVVLLGEFESTSDCASVFLILLRSLAKLPDNKCSVVHFLTVLPLLLTGVFTPLEK